MDPISVSTENLKMVLHFEKNSDSLESASLNGRNILPQLKSGDISVSSGNRTESLEHGVDHFATLKSDSDTDRKILEGETDSPEL